MHYIFLALAIVSEVCATVTLKATESFTVFWPSLVVICGYCLSFYFLSLTLDKIPVGISYAIWSGVGIVLVTVGGYFIYKQSLDLPAVIGIALIVLGVLVVTGLSKSQAH